MRRVLSLVRRALVKLAARILRLLPRRFRPYAKTTGNVMLEMPSVVDGYLFGQRFTPAASRRTADSPKRAIIAVRFDVLKNAVL